MIRKSVGGNSQKRESPTANWANSGNPQSGADNMDNSTLRFCSGNSGIIQRKIIRHLLAICDPLDHASNTDRLEMAGTDAIRTVCQPWKNPMEYVSQLRAINGRDCLLSIPVEESRNGTHGTKPVYYWLPVATRQLWREALQKPQQAGAGEVQP